ncbi:MAG: hypothetical protein CMI32_08725 [Opitutales bacterium]|nr:hypothetical protein [Opitutales bacterium]
MRFFHRLLPAGICLLACFPSASRAVEVNAPLFEEYLQGGRVGAFVEDARVFLTSNPQSLYAPRVAHDLLVVGAALGNDELVADAKRRLLLDYTSSVQAGYLASTFAKAEDFRNFLVDAPGPAGELAFARKFCRVVKLGFRRFGAEFLDDPAFRVRCYLHSKTAGEVDLMRAVLPELRRRLAENEKEEPALGVLLDEELSNLAKLRRLHVLLEAEELVDLEFYLDFHAAALTEEERSGPEVAEILTERAVWGDGGQQALALLDTLPKTIRSDPKYLVLRAKVLWGGERGEDALTDLAKAAEGKGAWAETATGFADGVRGWNERRPVLVGAILAAAKSFSGETTGLDAEITFFKKEEDGKNLNYSAYIGIIPDKNLLQVHVREGENTKFAYRTDAKSSGLYLSGWKKVMRFATSGPVPAPNFTLQREEGGGFNLQGGATIAASLDAAKRSGAGLLDSPYLSTPLGLNALLENTVRRKGGWIEASRKEGKVTLLSVRTLQRFNPKGTRFTVGVDANGALQLIRMVKLDGSTRVEIGKIRYGDDSFELRPVVWPDLPVEDREQFDFSVIAQVMSAIGQAFESE